MFTNQPNETIEKDLEEEEIGMSTEQIPDEMLTESAPILGDTPEELAEDDDFALPEEPMAITETEEAEQEEGEDEKADSEEGEEEVSVNPKQKVTGAAMAAAMEFTRSRNASRRKAPRMQNAESGTKQEKIRPNADEILPAFIAANSAKNSHTIINGQRVTGVVNNESMDEPAAVCMFKDIPVYIPYSEFFVNATPKISRGDKQRFLTPCIGAVIDYVITDIKTISTPADRGRFIYVAYGSRLPAMRFLQNRYFGPNARRKIEIGSEVEGTVLSIHRTARSITIYACGMDRSVVLGDITGKYTSDITKLGYVPGQPIRVRVAEMKKDSDGNLVSIRFSARQIEEDRILEKTRDLIRQMVFSNYAIFTGVIRDVSRDSHGTHYYVALCGKKYAGITIMVNGQHLQSDAMASIPTRGSYVQVSLRNVNIERPDKLTGVILRKVSDVFRDDDD